MYLFQSPPDGGILYTETNLHNFFPEPLNAVTSMLFLLLAIYWTFRLRGKAKQHTFLMIALILLYIGGVGGTIYHGLRQWRIFIMMDWLPIMMLCISAGVYFLAKATRWYYAVSLVVLYAAFQVYARQQMVNSKDFNLFFNINYAGLASVVLLPVFAYLIITRFRYGRWVGCALMAFVLALTFRVADQWQWMPIGTHFLWHVFGAVAAWCMFQYIYLINETDTLVIKKPVPRRQEAGL